MPRSAASWAMPAPHDTAADNNQVKFLLRQAIEVSSHVPAFLTPRTLTKKPVLHGDTRFDS